MKSTPAARSQRAVREASEGSWTFLTHHAHVLLSVAADPEARLRDLAEKVGLTERAIQRIVSDLVAGGYVSITKVGRRNRYRVNTRLALRHPIERHRTVKVLVELVLGSRG